MAEQHAVAAGALRCNGKGHVTGDSAESSDEADDVLSSQNTVQVQVQRERPEDLTRMKTSRWVLMLRVPFSPKCCSAAKIVGGVR